MALVLIGCGPSISDGGPDYEVTGGPSSGSDDVVEAPASSTPTADASDTTPDEQPIEGSSDAGADAHADADAGHDAAPPAPRIAATTTVWSRRIALHLDDGKDTGWATIDNGDPTDEVWLDRSFDNGAHWEPKLGDTTTPAGSRGTRTAAFSVYDATHKHKGELRACGKAGNRPEIACTPWRTTL